MLEQCILLDRMETLKHKEVSILLVSNMSNNRLCYEGCDVLLVDGTVCGLGQMARRAGVGREANMVGEIELVTIVNRSARVGACLGLS